MPRRRPGHRYAARGQSTLNRARMPTRLSPKARREAPLGIPRSGRFGQELWEFTTKTVGFANIYALLAGYINGGNLYFGMM